MTERVAPTTEVDLAPVIAELVRGQIARSERIATTLRRVELTDGRVLGVKQYARGRGYATEGAALRELAGVVPVPDIACTLDRVIAYRWIDGVTLDEAVRRDPTALRRLAAPLGQLLGALAVATRAARPAKLAAAHAALERGPTRALVGAELADAVGRRLAAVPLHDPACFVHGELSARAVIVARSLDRIAGVVDWEAATVGSPLIDVGRLLRGRADDALGDEFAHAHGRLPADWPRRARLVDAARIVLALDAAPDRADAPELCAHLAAIAR